jgi:ATPase subunit of ABC transporter with duplicated ATPase domains
VVKFDFRRPPRSGDDVAMLRRVSKAYGPRRIYQDFDFSIQRTDRWCVVGRNGAGKSTLLKMVAGVLEPDAGTVRLGASLKLGYFSQQALDLLDPSLNVLEQMQHDYPDETQGILRSMLGAFHFSGRDVEKPIRVLSGGERSRLVMARMLLDPPNFLVLDEPTNHLDLETKEMLVDALRGFEGTMLFVSHDRTFLKGLGTRVLELEYGEDGERRPHLYPGTYLEYVQKTGREAPGIHA